MLTSLVLKNFKFPYKDENNDFSSYLLSYWNFILSWLEENTIKILRVSPLQISHLHFLLDLNIYIIMAKSEKKFPFVAQYRHVPLLTFHTVTENGKSRTVGVLTGLSNLQLATTANTVVGICTTLERQWNSRVAGTVKWLMASSHLTDRGCCHGMPQLTSGEWVKTPEGNYALHTVTISIQIQMARSSGVTRSYTGKSELCSVHAREL